MDFVTDLLNFRQLKKILFLTFQYGPTCSALAKESGENPCQDGYCIDSCDDSRGYICKCDQNEQDEIPGNTGCRDKTGKNPKLSKTPSFVSTSSLPGETLRGHTFKGSNFRVTSV